MKIKCWNCGHEFEGSFSNDDFGWHFYCEKFNSSFDVDINKYLVPRGTKVKFHGDRIGIVDWNDEEVTEEFENINYCVCPIEFTNEEYWSDYYVWLLRDDFEVVEN
jgi:hypothetical protein